ncbi:hypothetical protein [Pseudovibrio sp. Tun.PSC04-5.I4]|uniref:hypothetical protein n=1 Tax=Pseudovibrio sp. Tun.PSC04-5.I4 TaxID=1798213 RepID=UPI0008894FFA|nr:hypothetical protein [Pseudovibrio sp. Tun.PSC04-5.I4]SDR19079.1 hypothetical protein SAMN04515695_3294 [Pseudovibrio sp. Tun.PSC04-5.I4]
MDITTGADGFSGQHVSSGMLLGGGIASRFLDNDYLIGLGLVLQKKGSTEYLTASGNTVQRWIGKQLQRVTLQYTNSSFYFSFLDENGIVVYDYLPQDERLAYFNEYAHVGRRVATVKKQQICETHEIMKETRVAGAVSLLLADYPGTLTMLHPIKTRRWLGTDRIDWYARRGGRHYRIETSKAGAALRQWSNNQILLRVSPHQIHLHMHMLPDQMDEEI